MIDRSPQGRDLALDFVMGDWLVQPALNRLCRGDAIVRLRPQLMDLLVCLSTRAGRTVTKDEILDVVWPGQHVVESGMARCVAELRRALGDTARQDSRYIETIAKRGYRLVTPVSLPPAALGGAHVAAVEDVTPATGGPTPQARPPTEGPPSGPLVLNAAEVRPGATWLRHPVSCRAVFSILVAAIGFLAWHLPTSARSGRDAVVLAFDNRTGDKVLDEAARLALLVHLERSSCLRAVPEHRLRAEMGASEGSNPQFVNSQEAIGVCRRVGANAVLAGSLTPLGRRFVIRLDLVGCRSGEVLVRHRLEVDGKEDVLAGLGRAVSRFRQRTGEQAAPSEPFAAPTARAPASADEGEGPADQLRPTNPS